MYSRRLKTGYFVLEGLNSAATVFYLYYFYFYMQRTFSFGNKANLCLAALSGGTYALFAWGGGRFAQRFGYFTALKIGFLVGFAAGFPENFAQACWSPIERVFPLGWMLDMWVGSILAALVAGWLYKD